MTSTPTPPPEPWKPDELRLRKKEVRIQLGAGIAQALLSVATVGAVFVALWVALQGQQSLKSATQNNLQQAQDSQLSTALTSLGSTDVTERTAGLALLELDVADRLTPTSIAAFGKASAFNYYTTALEIFSSYLQSHGVGNMTVCPGAGTQRFGLGYGSLSCRAFTIDTQYAADEVSKMLGLTSQVRAVSATIPAIDLANDELYQVNLKGMNLSWVNAYMVGIDLRGAIMYRVHLGKLDNVEHSHLQCADLQYADLQGADLTGANLSGADLDHANLRDATLTGANLTGASVEDADFSGARHSQTVFTSIYGSATGLPAGVVTAAAGPPIQPSCLANPSYGDPPMP